MTECISIDCDSETVAGKCAMRCLWCVKAEVGVWR